MYLAPLNALDASSGPERAATPPDLKAGLSYRAAARLRPLLSRHIQGTFAGNKPESC